MGLVGKCPKDHGKELDVVKGQEEVVPDVGTEAGEAGL